MNPVTAILVTWRTLRVRPRRTLILLLGYGLGVAVMIALLAMPFEGIILITAGPLLPVNSTDSAAGSAVPLTNVLSRNLTLTSPWATSAKSRTEMTKKREAQRFLIDNPPYLREPTRGKGSLVRRLDDYE